MEEIKNLLTTACFSLILGEILYYLTPKDKICDCVYSLFYTVILINAILGFTGFDFDISNYIQENKYQSEIDEKISEYYAFETENEMKKMINEALDVIHIKTRDITTKIIAEKDAINIESIKVTLFYASDIPNAKAVLEALFSNTLPIEVIYEE